MDNNKIGAEVFWKVQKWCAGGIGEHKTVRKVINENILETIEEKRILLNNTLHRKVNWVGPILRTNCLLYNAAEGQMTEEKGMERKMTQPLDDLYIPMIEKDPVRVETYQSSFREISLVYL